MAEQTALQAEKRTEFGTRACRRLRGRGFVPGNVYGHRQESLAIAVPEEAIRALITSGHKVVNLQLDGGRETALLKELQWDTFGMRIEHFDLMRVDADERVTVVVPLELKGTAPGSQSGGLVEHHLHHVTIECRVLEVPDSIPVKIGELQLGQAIHVSDLELPPGVTVKNHPEEMIVHITQAKAEALEAGAEPGPSEPEVIREKKPAAEEQADKGKK